MGIESNFYFWTQALTFSENLQIRLTLMRFETVELYFGIASQIIAAVLYNGDALYLWISNEKFLVKC
jgi:hypothetical protein